MSFLRRHTEHLKALPTDLKQRVLLWSVIFGVCAASHVWDLIDGGTGVYSWAPQLLELLFFALLLLDLAVVLLILALQKVAVALGGAVILAEAVLNYWGGFSESAPLGFPTLGLPLLGMFVVFVLGTAPRTWSLLKGARAGEEERITPQWG